MADGPTDSKQEGEDKRITWLREQITARLKAARHADTGDRWKEEQHYDALFLVDLKPGAGLLTSLEDVRDASLGLELCQPFENPRFLWACHDQATHIILNDPQQVIADCEMQLWIIGLYELWAGRLSPQSVHPELGAAACVASDALRHVASAYRHKPGYACHWG